MESKPQRPRRAPNGSGKGFLVGVRLREPQLKALDEWMARHRAWSRPEAARQLIKRALASTSR